MLKAQENCSDLNISCPEMNTTQFTVRAGWGHVSSNRSDRIQWNYRNKCLRVQVSWWPDDVTQASPTSHTIVWRHWIDNKSWNFSFGTCTVAQIIHQKSKKKRAQTTGHSWIFRSTLVSRVKNPKLPWASISLYSSETKSQVSLKRRWPAQFISTLLRAVILTGCLARCSQPVWH